MERRQVGDEGINSVFERMLRVELRVPESLRRCISLAGSGAHVILQAGGDAALQMYLHHWNADQEIAVADGVGHEVIGACAEAAQSAPGARHFDALERAGGV